MGMTIRGYDIEYLASCLKKVEDNLPVVAPKRKSGTGYRRIGNWLVSDTYLRLFIIRSLFRLNAKKIPMFCLAANLRGIVKGLILMVSSERIKMPIRAQAVLVKNNVRAFYPNAPQPFSTKMLISRIRIPEDMRNEISVRADMERQNTLKIPKILGSDLSFNPPFFCEEIIWGERPFPDIDDKIMSEVLSPELWRTYQRNGIEFKPLQDVYDWGGFLDDFSTSINRIPWENSYGDRRSFLDNVAGLTRSRDCLHYALGHGDLCPGNFIVTAKNDVYVVDWEQARERPIVFDLYEILMEFPSSIRYFQKEFENISASNTRVIPFNQQVCLAAFLKIKKWSDIFPEADQQKIPGLKRRLLRAISMVNRLSGLRPS